MCARAQAAVSTALPIVVVAGAAERDALGEGSRIQLDPVGDFGQFGAAADAGDEEQRRAAFREEVQRGLDPLGAAGERDDAVGLRRRRGAAGRRSRR